MFFGSVFQLKAKTSILWKLQFCYRKTIIFNGWEAQKSKKKRPKIEQKSKRKKRIGKKRKQREKIEEKEKKIREKINKKRE